METLTKNFLKKVIKWIFKDRKLTQKILNQDVPGFLIDVVKYCKSRAI